jgi:hypothetical protein
MAKGRRQVRAFQVLGVLWTVAVGFNLALLCINLTFRGIWWVPVAGVNAFVVIAGASFARHDFRTAAALRAALDATEDLGALTAAQEVQWQSEEG